MNIQITADSTCDLGESVEKRGIALMPLMVILGGQTYHDGVDITPADIFSYVDKAGQLPKTAAPSIGEYEDFFRTFTEQGKTVIHFSISAKASSACSCDGGSSAEEIVRACSAVCGKVNTSFVPDRLDYLFKGGRCSRLSMYGANILKIHPLIEMDDGQLLSKKKYRGNMVKCIQSYISDLKAQYPAYDKTRCFVTHSCADPELVAAAHKAVAENFTFDEVLETVAGSVITGHCGRNTLGVLFIAE